MNTGNKTEEGKRETLAGADEDDQAHDVEHQAAHGQQPHDLSDPLEDAPVKTKPSPLKPTAKQIDEHICRGHIPYRSWCEECVRASAREDPHNRVNHDDDIVPTFACDYAFLTSESDPNDKITLFILKEFQSKSIFACVCPKKGTECQVSAELFLDAMQELGLKNSRVLFRSDQEPAIQAVLDMV